jgi:hypothetical protein
MKTLTQVVLPIAAIAGLVYGITFITSYSRRSPSDNSESKPKAKQLDKLVFARMAGNADPVEFKFKLGSAASPWRSNYETLEHGHFDFWFQNQHDQEVRLGFTTGNCSCIGADLAVIPTDAWAAYLKESAASGIPGMPASPILAALNAMELESRVRVAFKSIAHEGRRNSGQIPAASADGPQIGILRSNFEIKVGKIDPTVVLKSTFAASLPNSPDMPLDFQVIYHIVPSFEVNTSEVRLGDLYVGSKVAREFICWSRTRPSRTLPEMALDISTQHDFGDFKDCVEWSKPEKLTPDEMEEFAAKVLERTEPKSKEEATLQIQESASHRLGVLSAYRVRLNVVERRDVMKNGKLVHEQLDLGPLEFALRVTLGDAKTAFVAVRGVVRGDVRLVGDQGADRLDFGPSFPSNQLKTKQMSLISDRRGLDLEVVKKECSPEYLDIALLPESEKDGCKKWILSVTIPDGRLYGALTNGYVVLRTKDPTPRKFRIPVKASTFDR